MESVELEPGVLETASTGMVPASWVQAFDFSVKEGLTLALTGFNTLGSSLCPSNTMTLG